MLKLLHIHGLYESLREFGYSKPVFGTCGGDPDGNPAGITANPVRQRAHGRLLDWGGEDRVEAARVLRDASAGEVLIEQGRHLAATFPS